MSKINGSDSSFRGLTRENNSINEQSICSSMGNQLVAYDDSSDASSDGIPENSHNNESSPIASDKQIDIDKNVDVPSSQSSENEINCEISEKDYSLIVKSDEKNNTSAINNHIDEDTHESKDFALEIQDSDEVLRFTDTNSEFSNYGNNNNNNDNISQRDELVCNSIVSGSEKYQSDNDSVVTEPDELNHTLLNEVNYGQLSQESNESANKEPTDNISTEEYDSSDDELLRILDDDKAERKNEEDTNSIIENFPDTNMISSTISEEPVCAGKKVDSNAKCALFNTTNLDDTEMGESSLSNESFSLKTQELDNRSNADLTNFIHEAKRHQNLDISTDSAVSSTNLDEDVEVNADKSADHPEASPGADMEITDLENKNPDVENDVESIQNTGIREANVDRADVINENPSTEKDVGLIESTRTENVDDSNSQIDMDAEPTSSIACSVDSPPVGVTNTETSLDSEAEITQPTDNLTIIMRNIETRRREGEVNEVLDDSDRDETIEPSDDSSVVSKKNENSESHETNGVSTEAETHDLSISDEEPLDVSCRKKKNVEVAVEKNNQSKRSSSSPLKTDNDSDVESIYLSGIEDNETEIASENDLASNAIKPSSQCSSPTKLFGAGKTSENNSHVVLIPEYMIKEEIFVDETDDPRSPDKDIRSSIFADFPNLKIDPDISITDVSIKVEKIDWSNSNLNLSISPQRNVRQQCASKSIPQTMRSRRVIMGKKPSPKKITSCWKNDAHASKTQAQNSSSLKGTITSVKSKSSQWKPNKSKSMQPKETSSNESLASRKTNESQMERKSKRQSGVPCEINTESSDSGSIDSRTSLFPRIKMDNLRKVARKSTRGTTTAEVKKSFSNRIVTRRSHANLFMRNPVVRLPRIDVTSIKLANGFGNSGSKRSKRVSFINEQTVEGNLPSQSKPKSKLPTASPAVGRVTRPKTRKTYDNGNGNKVRSCLKRSHPSSDEDGDYGEKAKKFRAKLEKIFNNGEEFCDNLNIDNESDIHSSISEGIIESSLCSSEEELMQTKNNITVISSKSKKNKKNNSTSTKNIKSKSNKKPGNKREIAVQNSKNDSIDEGRESAASNSKQDENTSVPKIPDYETGIKKYVHTAEHYRVVMSTYYECECCQQKFHLLESMREHVRGHFPNMLTS